MHMLSLRPLAPPLLAPHLFRSIAENDSIATIGIDRVLFVTVHVFRCRACVRSYMCVHMCACVYMCVCVWCGVGCGCDTTAGVLVLLPRGLGSRVLQPPTSLPRWSSCCISTQAHGTRPCTAFFERSCVVLLCPVAMPHVPKGPTSALTPFACFDKCFRHF